ncbi:hypothetical protein GCM10008015_18880 [Flavobacterium palustre]|uniref:DUF6268 domain-containing protein n=1 Tax=Flavobacterium palustre TaxID=1476463 RepID=A0ABQ1HJL5_9FLAO|nr:DUF6268 family outer membrane beta-barrel protein [Flavobacterium palustre]GGA78402.1 hypothetical protein GCM10008015_18880 [Flavobacterium palustre]
MKLKVITTLIFMMSIPEITAQSNYSLELNLKTIPTREITKNESGIGFYFHQNLDSKNKITNSLTYKNSSLNYSLHNDVSENNNKYNWIENKLVLTHQINNKINWDLELKTVASFENKLNIPDITLLGGAGIGYAFNEKNNIHLGVQRMTVFGKAQILPTFAFQSQFNSNTSIEIGFPNSSIRYSNNERNAFRLTNVFDGEYYNLDQPKVINNLSATKISFSQMTTALEYERNVDSNWYMSFQGGYQFDKKYTLTNNRGTTKYNFDANDGFLFNIGIKYKQ